jgi:hypothetical protein
LTRLDAPAPPKRRALSRVALLRSAIGLAAAIVAYVWAQAATPHADYDLTDPGVARLWLGAGDIPGVQATSHGLEIIGEEGGLVTSPEPSQTGTLARTPWRDARFVVIEVVPRPYERAVAVVWFPQGGAAGPRMVATLAPGVSRLVVDTQRRKPWLGGSGWVDRFPSASLVRRVGLAFRGEVVIRRITVEALLPARDLLALTWDDLTTVEPVLASSINFHYGPSVVGISLSIVLGLLLTALGLVALPRRRQGSRALFLAGGLVLFVLFDLTAFHGLWRQVLSSRQISAWHASRLDEYRSRFGDDFAQLDALVRERVPRGTPVALPDPPSTATPRMTNWLWFLYQGEYANLADRARDNTTIPPGARYVIFDQPRLWVYEPASGQIRSRVTGDTVAVRPVATVSDNVMLLEVAR